MIIAIDYDNAIQKDYNMFEKIMHIIMRKDNEIVIVTDKRPSEKNHNLFELEQEYKV